MSQDRDFSHRDIDKLFQGGDVDPDLLAVAEWTAAVRSAADIAIGSSTAAEHVAASAQAAAARVPVGQALGAVGAHRSPMFTRLYRSFAARVTTIASALVLATTGVAAAGVLPDAVQEPVADVYGIVGLDFHPDDDGEGAAGDADDDGEDLDNDEDEDGQLGVTETTVAEEEAEDGKLDELDDDESSDEEDEDEGDQDDESSDEEDEDEGNQDDDDSDEDSDDDSDEGSDDDSEDEASEEDEDEDD